MFATGNIWWVSKSQPACAHGPLELSLAMAKQTLQKVMLGAHPNSCPSVGQSCTWMLFTSIPGSNFCKRSFDGTVYPNMHWASAVASGTCPFFWMMILHKILPTSDVLPWKFKKSKYIHIYIYMYKIYAVAHLFPSVYCQIHVRIAPSCGNQ